MLFKTKYLTKQGWRLALAVQVTWCCGCLSGGSRLADTQDPFLEPSAVATPSASPQPLPPVVAPAATEVAQAPVVRLMEYAEEVPQAEVVLLSQPATQPMPVTLAGQIEVEQIITVEQPGILPQALIAPEAPIASTVGSGVYPIDLANALGLGGADNLQVRLARTRLFQAQARHLQAKTLWLPSLRLGIGYNKHDGRLQETTGNVIEVERNSLFYGGGFGLGGMPLNGGAGGPPRLAVNLSLADAYFKPLAACQEVAAHGAAERVASNDSLAEIAIGYHSLLEAHGRLANAEDARGMAEKMVGLVENFEQEGFSSKTEVSRARTALGRWQRDVADAERQTVTTSAKLARVLRLPAQVQLVPAEEFVLPIEVIEGALDVDSMVAEACLRRPEISRQHAFREAACFRVQEEKWRPWIPNVQAGASGGGFGGGPSTTFPSASDRSDVDLLGCLGMAEYGPRQCGTSAHTSRRTARTGARDRSACETKSRRRWLRLWPMFSSYRQSNGDCPRGDSCRRAKLPAQRAAYPRKRRLADRVAAVDFCPG